MQKRRLGALLVILAAGFATSPVDARASTCDYVGASGATWHNAINWSCDSVPSADADGIPDGDDAVRILGTDNVVVDSQNEAAKTLAVDTGATLQLAATRTLAVSGATTLGQATISGAGTLAANGAWVKSGSSTLVVSGATMALGGGSDWSDGTVCLNDAATWTVSSVLTVQATADNIQHCGGAIGKFLITGTGRLDVVGGNRFINAALDNDGVVDLAGGQFTVSGPPANEHAGRWQIGAPAALIVSNDLPLKGAGVIDGAGLLQ